MLYAALMAFKTFDEILAPDPRFEAHVVHSDARFWPHDLSAHHRMVGSVDLAGSSPAPIRKAFDRARNLLLYAYFDYDLLVNGEIQAFGALELALKHRLIGPDAPTRATLRNLADQARKRGIFPKALPDRPFDRLGALVELRNALSHGTTDIHTPGIAMDMLESCAWAIDTVFPPGADPHPGP